MFGFLMEGDQKRGKLFCHQKMKIRRKVCWRFPFIVAFSLSFSIFSVGYKTDNKKSYKIQVINHIRLNGIEFCAFQYCFPILLFFFYTIIFITLWLTRNGRSNHMLCRVIGFPKMMKYFVHYEQKLICKENAEEGFRLDSESCIFMKMYHERPVVDVSISSSNQD